MRNALSTIDSALGEPYYVYNGQTVSQSFNSDPDQLQAKEWQVWLYHRGQSTGRRDYHGILSAMSAEAAMKKLKAAQDFEVEYGHFFNKPADYEKDTYFNPLGPIAIIDAAKPTPERMLESLDKLAEFREQFELLRLALRKRPDQYNPFSEVGKVLKEYTDALSEAQKGLSEITKRINAYYYATDLNLEAGLTEVERSLASAATLHNKVEASLNASDIEKSVWTARWATEETQTYDKVKSTITETWLFRGPQLIYNSTENQVYNGVVSRWVWRKQVRRYAELPLSKILLPPETTITYDAENKVCTFKIALKDRATYELRYSEVGVTWRIISMQPSQLNKNRWPSIKRCKKNRSVQSRTLR